MASQSAPGSRERELWRRLGEVNDPELDEPVTEMGFIERAEILGDGSVELEFRLPTYWCSPNFAFLMLDGVRTALDRLSWAPKWRITLQDHMFADEVNKGVAEGKSFGAIFGELAGDLDLGALREKFRVKAFQRRQEAMLVGLRAQGLTHREILGMDLTAFDAVRFSSEEAAKQKPRYRSALLEQQPGRKACEAAFVTVEGESIAVDEFDAYLGKLRGVRINMEFNGALCRGLKSTRYKELGSVDGEPTLVDFIMDRAPARAEQAV